jgi:hypothetical protein
LRHLSGIQSLDFVGNPNLNQTLDLEIIGDLNWLESLSISHLKTEHLSALATFANLIEIKLEYIGLGDVTVLTHNPSLRHISILEKNELAIGPLRSLPNVQSLNVNGVWQDLMPLGRQVLGGVWNRFNCIGPSEDDSGVDKFYVNDTLSYNDQRSEISYAAQIYANSNCLGLPLASYKTTGGIKSLIPTENPLVFKLDFSDKFVTSLFVYNDSGLSEEMKMMLQKSCPYQLGVLTDCARFNFPFPQFTSVKRKGDNLYFAIESDQHDGSSPQMRYTEFEAEGMPYTKKRPERNDRPTDP